MGHRASFGLDHENQWITIAKTMTAAANAKSNVSHGLSSMPHCSVGTAFAKNIAGDWQGGPARVLFPGKDKGAPGRFCFVLSPDRVGRWGWRAGARSRPLAGTRTRTDGGP
jgi:hypothetical protein